MEDGASSLQSSLNGSSPNSNKQMPTSTRPLSLLPTSRLTITAPVWLRPFIFLVIFLTCSVGYELYARGALPSTERLTELGGKAREATMRWKEVALPSGISLDDAGGKGVCEGQFGCRFLVPTTIGPSFILLFLRLETKLTLLSEHSSTRFHRRARVPRSAPHPPTRRSRYLPQSHPRPPTRLPLPLLDLRHLRLRLLLQSLVLRHLDGHIPCAAAGL